MQYQQQKNYIQTPISLIKFQPPVHIANLKLYQNNKTISKKQKQNANIQEIINIIIPPRQIYSKIGQLFVQHVNNDKVKREDVDGLKQKLDRLLIHQKAKNQGICSIRQKLFSEAFDQIIRQILIDCPERGIMLMRVRDQLKMTLCVYQTLYKESLSFSRIKISENESSFSELQKQYSNLKQKQNDLQIKRAYLQSKKESLQLKGRQFKTVLKDKREHEIQGLEIHQIQLNIFLDKIKVMQNQQTIKTQALNNQNDDDIRKI